MKRTIATVIVLTMPLCVATTAEHGEPPKGWLRAGSRPQDYEMFVDRAVTRGGTASASLKTIVAKTSGFGTLMQTFKADAFRGKRLRLSGFVRSSDASDWAGLWMRVDGARGQPLAFDNMRNRPITGTTEWRRYDVVLDVPEEAQQIAFGLLLNGLGQVWMDDLQFEPVGTDTPTTGETAIERAAKAPANLDFEQ